MTGAAPTGTGPTCACGAVPLGPLGVCATCEDDLRELLLPATRTRCLTQIATMAEAHQDERPFERRIALIARHGLTLKG